MACQHAWLPDVIVERTGRSVGEFRSNEGWGNVGLTTLTGIAKGGENVDASSAVLNVPSVS